MAAITRTIILDANCETYAQDELTILLVVVVGAILVWWLRSVNTKRRV